MRFVPHCRSTQSSSGDAMRSAPAAGLWQETLTACRSARRRFWTSWSSIRSGRSAPTRRRGESRREFSSVPGSRVPPRTTAPAAIVRWDTSKSLPMAGLPSIATASRSAPALERRRPIASPRIWVPSPTKSRWRASTHFGPLGLVASGNPYTMDQQVQDAAARNPRWVPAISSGTGASTSAHVGIRPAGEAARVIFRFGLWPAALELWGIAPNDPRANQWEKARWNDGQLILPGLAPLPLPAIAAKAHARNGVTGAMAHSFNRWAWSQATFAVAGQAWTADIDALAVRRGVGKYIRIDRSSVKFPPTNLNRSGPTYTALCGSVVRIEIDRGTGVLRIAKAYSVLECGQALVPQLVLGQAQGGFAMGVGYALLESLPLYEDGPGNGKWNLDQYRIARGSDLPLNGLAVEVLPPVAPDERPKGVAEVVMMPVVPALLNAIYDATGHRFQSLPVTQATIKRVLK